MPVVLSLIEEVVEGSDDAWHQLWRASEPTVCVGSHRDQVGGILAPRGMGAVSTSFRVVRLLRKTAECDRIDGCGFPGHRRRLHGRAMRILSGFGLELQVLRHRHREV